MKNARRKPNATNSEQPQSGKLIHVSGRIESRSALIAYATTAIPVSGVVHVGGRRTPEENEKLKKAIASIRATGIIDLRAGIGGRPRNDVHALHHRFEKLLAARVATVARIPVGRSRWMH
jgi:hypothetical protein